MKKLLLLLVGVLTAFISQATNFEQGKTYYVSILDVTWFKDDGATMRIWDGGKDIVATKVADNLYSWVQQTTSQNTVYIKRSTGSDDSWVDHNQWTASNPTSNYLKLNGSGVTWLSYPPFQIKTNLNGSDNTYPLDASNNYTFKYTFTGNESSRYMGMLIDNKWNGTKGDEDKTYNGTSRTYTMTERSGGDITFAANLHGEVSFVFNPSNNQLSVSGINGGGNEGGDYPGGVQCYVMGNFSLGENAPILLVYSGGRYIARLSCTNPDGWRNMIFYTVTPAENEGDEPVIRYYSSNGKKAEVNSEYRFSGEGSEENWIDVSNLDNEKTYTITFSPFADNPYARFTEFNENHTDYYLCGDINLWSDITNRNTDSKDHRTNHGFFFGENNADYFYLQDDPDNPWIRFKSKEELETQWKFQYIGPGPDGTTGNDWYRLNLSARAASDINDNVGRLGGQFKIINGYLEGGEGYGVNANNDYAEYWKKLLKIGEVFQAQKSGAQNIMLYNTTVENADIWFNPTTEQIVLLGNEKDLYLYYANNEHTEYSPKVYLNASEQTNNYPPEDPFREYNNAGQAVSPSAGDFYNYRWEQVAEAEYKPYGNTGPSITLNNVWRKKIPSAIIHRTPMPYLTSVEPYDATNVVGDQWFPRQRIDCEDIWFIESTEPVHVFFRFADDAIQNSTASRVFFDAWLDQYDANGALTDTPKYLKEEMTEMVKIDSNSTGDLGALWNTLPDDKKTQGGEDLSWFAYPEALPLNIANGGHAMFSTSYGSEYPSNFHNASVADRESVELNGHDLFYVVGGSSSRVGILYSHLNGTFAKGDADKIQINAEFFARNHRVFKDNDLNTTIGTEVDYQFNVYDSNNDLVMDESDAEEWFDEPYYNWTVKDLNEGLYRVKVRVRKLVNGKYEYYSSNDIYTIFPAR